MLLKRQDMPVHDIDESIRNRIFDAEESVRQGQLPDKKERVAFEHAYFELCTIVAPINVRTIRATCDGLLAKGTVCEARRLARRVWRWTGIFILLAAIGQVLIYNVYKWPPEFDVNFWELVFYRLVKFLFPFAYGGVGACAYILRSGVGFIGSREFDPHFASEYSNRIWLGVLIGGLAYHLLGQIVPAANEDPGDNRYRFQMTESLMGFLGGYFNDRIVRTFERLVDAILPGVTLQVAEGRDRGAAPPPQRLPTESLVQLLKETQDPDDKKFIMSLLDKIAGQRR
jgi:hypothetical protein